MAGIRGNAGRDNADASGVFWASEAIPRIGVSVGAFFSLFPWHGRRGDGGVAWALVVAVLFLALAALSFALDQSVTLSSPPVPPGHSASR